MSTPATTLPETLIRLFSFFSFPGKNSFLLVFLHEFSLLPPLPLPFGPSFVLAVSAERFYSFFSFFSRAELRKPDEGRCRACFFFCKPCGGVFSFFLFPCFVKQLWFRGSLRISPLNVALLLPPLERFPSPESQQPSVPLSSPFIRD